MVLNDGILCQISVFHLFCHSQAFILFLSFTDFYLDYFTTPYFIFVRDSLSYLTLLGLHFALCLSPPTLAFSRLEWVILIFFLGRIAIEVDQFMGARKGVRKAAARQTSHQGSSYAACSPADDIQTMTTSSEENVVLKKFSNYFRYAILLNPNRPLQLLIVL